jgi:hypothetical protein
MERLIVIKNLVKDNDAGSTTNDKKRKQKHKNH